MEWLGVAGARTSDDSARAAATERPDTGSAGAGVSAAEIGRSTSRPRLLENGVAETGSSVTQGSTHGSQGSRKRWSGSTGGKRVARAGDLVIAIGTWRRRICDSGDATSRYGGSPAVSSG
ncbi:putative formin-like protein 6 isoform X1 [Iris pallida]|uniref:Formin-like protein 6 isoform X1 n=1 Tax=Iris pallida TaxID=29817 RepID=A0AAX6I5H9_IRIPA|nr:putative formin-like protein 6 isoform X1 [Iris pallida]